MNMSIFQFTYVTAFAFVLGGCATISPQEFAGNEQTENTAPFIAPESLTAKFGPCPFKAADDKESAFLASIATKVGAAAIGKGVDLFFSALQNAGDPKKGRKLNSIQSSTIIDSNGYSNCLYLADGGISGRQNQTLSPALKKFLNKEISLGSGYQNEESDRVLPNLLAGDNSADTQPEPDIEEESEDIASGTGPGTIGVGNTIEDGIIASPLEPVTVGASEDAGAGTRSGTLGAESSGQNEPSSNRVTQDFGTTTHYGEVFKNAGIYFQDVPDFSGIFKFEYIGGAVRLIPINMTYSKRSKGKLFRTSKKRSLVLTMTFKDPSDATKLGSIGPFNLGRFSQSDEHLYDFGAYNVVGYNHSLRPTEWVKLPESLLRPAKAEIKPINFEVSLTEIQSASAVSAFIYDITKDEKESIKTELVQLVDKKAKKEAEIQARVTELTDKTAYYTNELIPTCEAIVALNVKITAGTAMTPAEIVNIANLQRKANAARDLMNVKYEDLNIIEPFPSPIAFIGSPTTIISADVCSQ